MAGDKYRAKAAEMDARARRETDPTARLDFERLAKGYRRLAEQADRNKRTDVTYEPPYVNAKPVQQQQPQPKPEQKE